jgi:hypothetical protein
VQKYNDFAQPPRNQTQRKIAGLKLKLEDADD